MLTSQERGNRFVRDAAIMSKPNILYAAHPLQGKAVTLNLKWEILPLWAAIDIAHCWYGCIFLSILKRMINLQAGSYI